MNYDSFTDAIDVCASKFFMTAVEKAKMSTYKKNNTDRHKDPSKHIIREIHQM